MASPQLSEDQQSRTIFFTLMFDIVGACVCLVVFLVVRRLFGKASKEDAGKKRSYGRWRSGTEVEKKKDGEPGGAGLEEV